MPDNVLDEIELDLLLEAVNRRYGYRLRDWEPGRVASRVAELVEEGRFSSISAFQEQILRDEKWMHRLIHGLWSQPDRGMFADPAFWRTLRWKIIPMLRTWPTIRAWVAGCGTGGEAWSLAVLFEEEGLGKRAVTHATDLDEPALTAARAGTASPAQLEAWEANYRLAGGLGNLTAWFDVDGPTASLRAPVRERVAFSRHVPAIEPSFNEFHLILFRNPFVWTSPTAREQVGALLRESQVTFGFLCLDDADTLQCLPRGVWSVVDRKLAIARRVG
jgi:chemotaxis protein methyltransferase CheR